MKKILFLILLFVNLSLFSSKVIILRHGQALHNILQIYNADPNSPNYIISNLTEEGIKQVNKTAQELLKLGINKSNSIIISSPMPRTIQTSEILIKNGVADKIEIDPRITEKFEGLLEGKKAINFETKDAEAYKYGAETNLDVKNRVFPVYTEILKSNSKNNIILVTHASPAKMLYNLFSGKNYNFKNADFKVIEV